MNVSHRWLNEHALSHNKGLQGQAGYTFRRMLQTHAHVLGYCWRAQNQMKTKKVNACASEENSSMC